MNRVLVSAICLGWCLATGRAASAQAPAPRAAPCDSVYQPFDDDPAGKKVYFTCALGQRPLPSAPTWKSGLPHWSGNFEASLTIVVTTNGAVDSASLAWSSKSWTALTSRADISIADSAFAAIRRLTFRPGMLGTAAVRTAIHVTLLASGAPDTAPATARWRYVVGAGSDTLRLEWSAGRRLGLGSVDSAATALLLASAELRMTQVDYGELQRGWRGCAEISADVELADSLRARLARSRTPLTGDLRCPAAGGSLDVRWTGLFRVSDSTYVAQFTYPTGMDGRTAGRCWVTLRARSRRSACG